MAHVADVDKSAEFYALLGFSCDSRFSGFDGRTSWVALSSGKARLFLARASGPVTASEQAVLFYLYSSGVAALREHLLGQGLPDAGNPPSERAAESCRTIPSGAVVFRISHPFYMPDGELRVHDPDGYVLLIGQREPGC